MLNIHTDLAYIMVISMTSSSRLSYRWIVQMKRLANTNKENKGINISQYVFCGDIHLRLLLTPVGG